MYIAKHNNNIVLIDESLENLQQGLKYIEYDNIEETDVELVRYAGQYLTQEEKEIKEQEELNKLSLTKREVFLALLDDKGITPEQLRAQITDTRALIEFDYASEYFRANPLINQIGASLGYTSEELDYLFKHKEFKDASVV